MKQLNWYQIFGKSNIPDGRTVLPTDDIQIWLNCADIWDKTYTTLAEVLADTDTLSALITSSNAVDYMVRSISWVGATIPVMTSNTTPSGECFDESSTGSTNKGPYTSFDGVLTSTASSWGDAMPDMQTTGYVGYEFSISVALKSAKAYLVSGSKGKGVGLAVNCTLQGSNDRSTWVDVSSVATLDFTNYNSGQVIDITLPIENHAFYSAYRLFVSGNTNLAVAGSYSTHVVELQMTAESITDNSTAMSYIGLNNYCANTLLADSTWCEAILKSEYVKSVCNIYVPKMTSNTTPSGVASASSIFDSNFPAWKAFDGDETTRWAVTAGSSLNSYIQYKFTEPVKINWVTMISGLYNNQPRIIAYKISGSNDGVTFTDLKNFTTNADGQDIGKVLDNSTAYMYYRQTVTNYRENVNEPILQFYGREDV